MKITIVLLLLGGFISVAFAGILKTGDDDNKCMEDRCHPCPHNFPRMFAIRITCTMNKKTCEPEWWWTTGFPFLRPNGGPVDSRYCIQQYGNSWMQYGMAR